MAAAPCLTLQERLMIQNMLENGASIKDIADGLGRNTATIYRELDRCPKGKYCAKQSNFNARRRKSSSPLQVIRDDIAEIKTMLEKLIRER